MIILGDNPFFGINHASAAKSRDYLKSVKARQWISALQTMRAAQEVGVNSFMVSTHAEAPDLLASMRGDPNLQRFEIIPAVPYLHRLNGLVASKGVPAALIQSISYPSLLRAVIGGSSLSGAGLAAFIQKEIDPIAKLGFRMPAIALQNIFVDLMLGLGLADIINEAALRIARSGRQLIAITMNPILADRLLDPSIIICTHYNVLGYMVQPDLKQFHVWLEKESTRIVWAMGVVASGRAKLEAVVADPKLRRFGGIVVGASRPESIQGFARSYAHCK
jgi:hypothetical protein